MTNVIRLKDLHQLPMKTQTDISVAPYPASVFTATQDVPYFPGALRIHIEGLPWSQTKGAAPGGMASSAIALPLNLNGAPITQATLKIIFALSSATAIQASEFGFKATLASGLTLPTNFQLDNSQKAGQTAITVIPPSGENGWDVLPNSFMPQLAPNVWHEVIQTVSWATGRMFTPQFTVDGIVIPVPAAQQYVSGLNLGWQKSTIDINLQSNTNAAGGSYDTVIREFQLTYLA
jgi:hypothetical protein